MNKSIDFDGLDGILGEGSARPFISPPPTPPPGDGPADSMPPPWMQPPRTPAPIAEAAHQSARSPTPKAPMPSPGGPRLAIATLVAVALGVIVGTLIVIDRGMRDDTDEQIEAIAATPVPVPVPVAPVAPVAPPPVVAARALGESVRPRVLFPASFAFNSPAPTMWPTKRALGSLAAELDECQGRILVVGHTCNLGAEETNVAKGLQRAQAARDELVRTGIDGARIDVASAGSKEPVASNATLKGRRSNRRVTVTCTASQ